MKIVRSADCGNSPKNAFVEALAIAMASRDVARLTEMLEPDVVWEHVGHARTSGRADVLKALESWFEAVSALEVRHAVSHGRVGACNGRLSFLSGAAVSWCHFLRFANAKGTSVQAIESYFVPGSDTAKKGG